MTLQPVPLALSLSKGCFFLLTSRSKMNGQGFDKLSPSGFVAGGKA
jgi:hypothetical protein